MPTKPDQITFRPDLRIVRESDGWYAYIGDYAPDAPQGFGETISEAVKMLALELNMSDTVQLEKILGGAKLE